MTFRSPPTCMPAIPTSQPAKRECHRGHVSDMQHRARTFDDFALAQDEAELRGADVSDSLTAPCSA